MELTRGHVTDRPWAQTLAALGLRRLDGQLTLHAPDSREYRVAFERGAVIGATSPLVTDSATRIALVTHLITSTQATEVNALVAAHPDRDEVEVLAKACALEPDLVLRLQRRVIAQRAARTFSVEAGDFVVDDLVTIPIASAAAVDIRAVVYLGVRTNVSDLRLARDLQKLGSHFALKPGAAADLRQFGLASNERPILEDLREGATLAELEAKHRDLDPRSVQSVIYSLVSCFACEATLPVLVADPTRTARGTHPPATTEAPPSRPSRPLDPLAAAAAAFRRGQLALRNDDIAIAIDELTTATDLNPHQFDYHATLAWAQFCGAADKTMVADKVRKMLCHSIQKSPDPEQARFYLGRMERMLGREREALRLFREVLDVQPANADAASEIRAIETRMAPARKPWLASLFGKKK